MHIQKCSITELNEMIPWERDIYMNQLRAHIEEENLKSLNDNRR